MAGIQSLGIGSGLLTSELVEQLVEAERAASDLRLDTRTARVEAKITAYAEVRNMLDGLSSSISSLSQAATIQSSSATSSNDSVLTASTSSTAEPGSYRINVDEIAKSHSLASKQYNSVDDTIGTGTLTFKFGTTNYDTDNSYLSFEQSADSEVTSIEINSENNTLGGVRDAINNADFGVSASVVYDGTGYRLLLTSDETGEETSMEITASGDAGLQALAYNGAQNTAGTNMEETQKGSDASVRINGLAITSTDNSLDQVIKGVTINLTETSDSAVTLNVSRDVSDIADKIDTFVEKYNEYKGLYDELTKYDPSDEIGGILLGDNVLRTVQTQLRAGISEVITGLTGSSYSSMIEIGLSTDQNDDFNLVFNRAKFEEAMANDAKSVVGLLATDKQASDAQISVVTVGPNTQPGSYDVNITKAATQGTYTGLSSAALSFADDVIVSDLNDQFSMNIDGTSKLVSLEQGTYSSGEDLALMLQTSINSAFVGQSVTVDFDDANDRFNITSSKFGSSSSVSFGGGDALVADTFGFATAGSGQYAGAYFSTLNDAAFAASTAPGTQALGAEEGVDFSTNPVSFDITVNGTGSSEDGITKSITLDEDWADVLDTDGEIVTDRDRADVLTYIQSELNNAGLAGVVTAEFNSSDRLVFRTDPAAGSQSITIANTSVTGVDYLGITDGTTSSGVSVTSNSFDLSYSNRYGSVSSAATINVPDGNYETAADLAAAMESAINADPNIAAGAQGAMTEKGSRDIGSAIDFSSDEAQFVFSLNGTDFEVTVNANGADNLDSIQTAIDTSLIAGGASAGDVVASLDSNGLVLTTAATGASETLEVKRDGIGATTAPGTVDLSTGVDFSATPATFSLLVDGQSIDVTVNGDGTAGSNDGESNLSVIQQALDTALSAAGGGGEFSAGDVVAKLDSSNQLYFETVSKNGVATETTFGADASIQITSADANANSALGVSAGTPNVNGFDGFGLDKGVYTGFDSQASVSYQADEDGKGRFVISFDNSTNITLSNVSNNAIAQLGMSSSNQAVNDSTSGQDVEGTINGVEATGRGQYLTASEGNEAATNGYLLGGTGSDFSSAEIIDGSNNTLKVVIDGVETNTVTLTSGAYASGDALAAELKAQINADSNLQAANKAVDVQYDEDTATFGIFSISKGAESTVRVSEIASGAIDVFGFTTSTQGVKGKDTVGSVDEAAGLMLKVTGTRTGDRGSVSYVEGVMKKLDDLFDSILNANGLLTVKEQNLEDEMDDIEVERTEVDERTAAFEARLRSKFLYNDKLISQLKTTEDFLTQQFEAMNASKE
ncbi:flagellar filament capping protein FliD [Reinekea blandensis]|uniref:Filament cap protein n=1 Tax=Reinekea blandensis MED297 TaxID=314283 RepID=A4BEP0_9GAMM|nr:flagellar filament capping protein FliD [Reinekea blandensis]EAR09467.1 Flagellar hook-associated protein 2 [Reinekea sp. MED297] [Reinekea blandensis MED297]